MERRSVGIHVPLSVDEGTCCCDCSSSSSSQASWNRRARVSLSKDSSVHFIDRPDKRPCRSRAFRCQSSRHDARSPKITTGKLLSQPLPPATAIDEWQVRRWVVGVDNRKIKARFQILSLARLAPPESGQATKHNVIETSRLELATKIKDSDTAAAEITLVMQRSRSVFVQSFWAQRDS